jgi:hypothetical protein
VRAVQLERLLEIADGLVGVAEPAQALADEEPDRRVSGLQLERGQEHAGGLAVPAQVHERPGEVRASLGAPGVEPDGLCKGRFRVGIAFGLEVREAEVVAKRGVVGGESRRPLQRRRGFRGLAHEAVRDPQEIVPLRSVWLLRDRTLEVLDRQRIPSLRRVLLAEGTVRAGIEGRGRRLRAGEGGEGGESEQQRRCAGPH